MRILLNGGDASKKVANNLFNPYDELNKESRLKEWLIVDLLPIYDEICRSRSK